MKQGMLGAFRELDATCAAIEELKKKKVGEVTVFTPTPRHEIEHAMHSPMSKVRQFTLVGALFLAVIAVMPSVVATKLGIPWIVAQFFGGTSLLIMVGVALDTLQQIESHLTMRNYEGLMKSGKIKGRSAVAGF